MPISASVAPNDRYMQLAEIWRKQVWLGEKWSIAVEKKINYVDKTKLTQSWQTWHRQRCLLTLTVTKYGAMQPLAKKLQQSSQECSLRQKCAFIYLSGLFPMHSNNCYAWICSISYNQASANLECCWTIQDFSSLLTGSCLLKAYYSQSSLI